VIAHLKSGGRRDDYRGVLSGRLMAVNNYGISLTITTGVAPLLFIQLIYQQYFYTATILLAPIWLGMLVLLTVGYYAAYLYKFRGAPARGQGGGLWLIVSALMILLIAMTLVIAIMSITRHQVRALYLEPATAQFQVQVVLQWGNFVLFAVLLAVGLATIAYMVYRVLTSPASGADAA